MTLTRALSLIGLVLALATGSVTMAMARHQVHAVHQVVICTGYGVVAITLDEDGNPTGPILPCPDSVPAVAGSAATGAASAVLLARTLVAVDPVPGAAVAPATAPRLTAHPRAPPVRA